MDRNSNKTMALFRAEAEEAFSNYHGDDDDDDNFSGDNDEDENYDGDDDDDEYFTGATGLDKIDPNDRTLSFSIVNSTAGLLVAELFGAYKTANALNFGNPAGIAVTLGESSYAQFLQETISSPMLIKGLRYFVTNEVQLANTLEMVEETATGTTTSKKYQPGTKVDPRSFKNNILIDTKFTFPVSGRHSLKVPVNPNEKITLIMTIGTRVDQAKTLQGKAVLEVGGKKRNKKRKQLK